MTPAIADIPDTYRPSPYYVQRVSDFTAGSTFLVTSQPNFDAKDVFLVAGKLGYHGFQRIETFRDYMPDWDFNRGQPMSELAYRWMCEFLKCVELPAGKRPSVFLASSGNLELAWEDNIGSKYQAEFGPSAIEFFRDNTGAEGIAEASDAGVREVAQILSV